MSTQTNQARNVVGFEVSDIGGLRRVFAKPTFNSEKCEEDIILRLTFLQASLVSSNP